MSTDNTQELLDVVAAFLKEQVLPELSGFKAYNTRVAVNTLRILSKQAELQPQLDALNKEAIDTFQLDDIQKPQVAIAKRIKNGDMAITPELLDYLKRRSLVEGEINCSKYASLQEAKSRWVN